MKATDTPTHPAHALLARAHSPSTALDLFTTKVKHQPLLIRPSSPPRASDNRALRRRIRLKKKEYFLRKQKPRPLSAKEKRKLGVHELKNDECKYVIYEGLHRLWIGYMQEVLGLSSSAEKSGDNGTNKVITPQVHGSLLATADFHGAEVEVVRCGCVDRVGLKGIVVRDTKFTFVVITKKDQVKSARPLLGWNFTRPTDHSTAIPKRNTVFRFEVPVPPPSQEARRGDGEEEQEGDDVARTDPPQAKPFVFELHGSQFELRAADRANRKFKWKPTDHV